VLSSGFPHPNIYELLITERGDFALASAAQVAQGKVPVTMRTVSQGTHIPYNTVRRYANELPENPNFAVVDEIRRFLNQFLSEEHQLADTKYIYPVDEDLGELVGLAMVSA
jgi:hypothetical protein